MRDDQVIEQPLRQQSLFEENIQIIADRTAAIKEFKSMMKDIEDDVPMELEDLLIALKDLKKQVKDRKAEHLKHILEENVEYSEYREQLQIAKEDLANAKLKLFTEAANQTRDTGDMDQTVLVQGAPFRVQSQKEIQVYLNGKVIK